MKCYACNKIFPLNAWRTVSIQQGVVPQTGLNAARSSRAKTTAYPTPSVQQFQRIYVCPYCGTLRMKGPMIKENKQEESDE